MPESSKPSNRGQEQYKIYLGDLGNIGVRYTAANGFYLSVLTALIAILALSEANKPLAQLRPGLVVSISVAALVVCWIWSKTIGYYAVLFRIKFDILRKLEEDLDARPFHMEWQALSGVEPLGANERRVPFVLGILFGVVSAASVLFRILG